MELNRRWLLILLCGLWACGAEQSEDLSNNGSNINGQSIGGNANNGGSNNDTLNNRRSNSRVSNNRSNNGTSNNGTKGTTHSVSIENIEIKRITKNTVKIIWSLSQSEKAWVEYGADLAYGQLQGDSEAKTNHEVDLVALTPSTLYHFRIVVETENGTIKTTEDQAFTTLADDGGFSVVHMPPVLVNPTTIVMPGGGVTKNVAPYNACGGGLVYSFTFADDEDALITFNGTVPLPYPVHITGGRNVIVRGLEIALTTQAGNGAGSIPLNNTTYNTHNPHPVVPACAALRLWVNNATHWIEGSVIDTKGHDADAVIVNDGNATSARVVFQNTRIQGIEGNTDLHGDILQTQSGHLKTLIFENVTMRQALEGIVLSAPVDDLQLLNVDYDTDPRYDSDDQWDDIVSGGFFSDNLKQIKTYTLKDVYVRYKNRSIDRYFTVANKHFSHPDAVGQMYQGITLEAHPEVHFKVTPPFGDFAPTAKVGRNYQP